MAKIVQAALQMDIGRCQVLNHAKVDAKQDFESVLRPIHHSMSTASLTQTALTTSKL
jgi:hypothetical protein